MIKPKTRITSFSHQTGVLPSGYQLLLHWPSANEKRQRDNENCYETTWMTPIKFKITIVPMTAATSGRKLIMVLYILFIVVLCSLLIVTGPLRYLLSSMALPLFIRRPNEVAPMDQTCTRISKSVPHMMYIGYGGRSVKPFFSSRSFHQSCQKDAPVACAH
jgi:hypothetical protein